MSKISSENTGPLIKIIQIGLELWLRKQCISIGKIKLKLYGSAIQILSVQLTSAKIEACNVNFKDLPLDYVEVESGPLKVNINLSSKAQKISLKEKFKIKGSVSLTSDGLNKMFLTEEWRWIKKWLGENLLNATTINDLSIEENFLKLTGHAEKGQGITIQKFLIRASSGNIFFKSIDTTREKIAILPMDPSIYIENAIFKEGKLIITGNSKVDP